MHAPRLRWGLLPGLATLTASVGIAIAATGDLDTSFGDGGRTTVDFGGSEDFGRTAVQPDGKIIAVGTTTNAVNQGDTTAFAIARLLPDGSLDTGFGDTGTGLQIYGLGPEARARGVVVQADGKIVVAGVGGATSRVFTFIRLNPNGTADRSFGTNGVTGVDIGPSSEDLESVALAPDGKIVAVGATSAPRADDSGDLAVVRLTPDGAPDASFGGGDAKFTLNTGTTEALTSVVVLPDGRITAAGSNIDDSEVIQLTPGGNLDTSFGSGGVATFRADPNSPVLVNIAFGIERLPDGKLLVPGTTVTVDQAAGTLDSGDFTVARLLPDGTLDPSFDTDGQQTIDFGGDEETAVDVALQENGSILVSGSPGEDGTGFNVARLTSSGALDPSFGSGGRASVFFGVRTVGGTLVLQPGGKAVIAGGRDPDGLSDDDDFVFARIDVSPPPAPPGGDEPPTATCRGAAATVVGTESNEKLAGGEGDDVIAGLGGNDKISGGDGNDVICGGDGKDKLAGDAGADTLLGEDGNDKLAGGGGPDKLKGGGGADVLNGGGGKNVVRGGPGVDVENP
jgi:uncharacterized delta-60 repeat protein